MDIAIISVIDNESRKIERSIYTTMLARLILRVFSLVTLISVVEAIVGCTTHHTLEVLQPGVISNVTTNAVVRLAHHEQDNHFIEEYCRNPYSKKNPLCEDPREVDYIAFEVGYTSWRIQLADLLAPKSANVHVGDVVALRGPTSSEPYTKFLGIVGRVGAPAFVRRPVPQQ